MTRSRRASVLLLVLWMLILLGIIGLSYSASVRNEIRAMRASRGRTEAIWAARAGVEKARVSLMATTMENLRDTDPLMNDAANFANQPVGHATFSLVKPQIDPTAEPAFGLLDESSRVNINSVGRRILGNLPGISQDLVDCLLDWRDDNDIPREQGAEAGYYLSLEKPYRPRNAAFHEMRELLRVKGWEPVFRTAYPDPYDRFSDPSARQPSPMNPEDARKMMDMITVWSMDDGMAPDGKARMDLGSVKASEMRDRISGLTEEEAGFIEKWRDGNQYQNATDLLNVKKPKQDQGNRQNNNNNRNRNNNNNDNDDNNNDGNNNDGANNNDKNNGNNDNNSGNNNSKNNNANKFTNENAFTLARVGEIIDYFKAGSQGDDAKAGKININTASHEVLLLLPDMNEQLADAIVSDRAKQAFAGAGGIASLNGMNNQTFTNLYRRLSARSTRFHVWSRGTEPDSGGTFTAEAVLAREPNDVKIIYWREY